MVQIEDAAPRLGNHTSKKAVFAVEKNKVDYIVYVDWCDCSVLGGKS